MESYWIRVDPNPVIGVLMKDLETHGQKGNKAM